MAGILKVDTIQNANADNIITQTNSTTLTIGTSGDTVTLAAGATSSGFGATYNGAVNWDTTPKTTTVTAASGVGYFINTTSGAVTVNLPAGTAGSIVAVSDYANTAATNNITIDPNGTDKINGLNEITKITTNGAAVTLIYVDATRGWKDVNDSTLDLTGLPPFVAATGGTILTCGDFKTHIFTGPGTFTVTNAGTPTGSNSVEYLVVAGGAGGGGNQGGGGGAGGYRQNYPSPTSAGLPVTITAYPITIGSGGAGNPGPGPAGGTSGNPSIFSTITSTGGGNGGGRTVNDAGSGGSGGGGGGCTPNPGGAGNTPPVSPPQGNTGGAGQQPDGGGGGGGGAGATGGNSIAPRLAGAGGNGSPIATTVFGPTAPSYGTPGPAPGRYFAGGAGGGSGTGAGGVGGSGGGATGAGGNEPVATFAGNGTVNTGGGGGGGGNSSGNSAGGTGGSGIVVIRYKFQ
jgi:hypothetical protein